MFECDGSANPEPSHIINDDTIKRLIVSSLIKCDGSGFVRIGWYAHGAVGGNVSPFPRIRSRDDEGSPNVPPFPKSQS